MTTCSRMRRVWQLAVGAAVAGTAVATAVPTAGAGGTATLEVVKEVVGGAPAGEFVIEVRCDTEGTVQMTFAGPGTQSLPLTPDTQDCEIEEIESLGAQSVSYFCADVVPPTDGGQGCQPVGEGGDFGQAQTADQVMRFTVTNTFAGDASAPPGPDAPPPPETSPATAGGTPPIAGASPVEEASPAGAAEPASTPGVPAPPVPVAAAPAVTG